MNEQLKKLTDHILTRRDRVIEIQRSLTAIPAIGPENGGQGEQARAQQVETWLKNAGILNIQRLDSPDSRVSCGFRPNIIACINGEQPRRLWLFGHLDVVPPGDRSAWKADPWSLECVGDLVYGRGVEDNQQALASMIVLSEAISALKIRPELGLGLVFMADEECGSGHGLGWILKKAANIFSSEDLYIVPDGGSPDGKFIETAEKGQLWIKISVLGRQRHASMVERDTAKNVAFASPCPGNAFLAASDLVCRLAYGLALNFAAKNGFFYPPYSTFVPTRHEENVEGINISPGKDVFYLDCRVLPETPFKDVLDKIDAICAEFSTLRPEIEVKWEVVQQQEATFTSPKSSVVGLLEQAIEAVYGVSAHPGGIGGATVAAFLRRMGLPAAVWSRILNTCHQPNECSSISSTLSDAAVFANILMNGAENA